ncbi:MAG: response regulator [Lachnospiraceae bacterium]|nr:response regulator [Lachnospiraceae bacterium]
MVSMFYFVVFLLSVAMLNLYMVRNRNVDRNFTLFAIMLAINCFGRYVLSRAQTLDTALWANRIIYIGTPFATFFATLVIARLCKLKIARWFKNLMAVFSGIVLVSAMTMGYNDWYYKEVRLVRENGYSYLDKVYGPLHMLFPAMMIMYGVIMIAFSILAIKKRREISIRTVISISTVCVSVISFYMVDRLTDFDVELVSVGYLVGIAIFIVYLERMNMYDMSTNIFKVMENIKEYGYIAFDKKYRYMNANAYAKKMFPEIKEWVVDKTVEPSDNYLWVEAISCLYNRKIDEIQGKTLCIDEKYYQLTVSSISYGKTKNVGYLMEFTDRTIENKYYKSIENYNIAMEKEVEEKTLELRQQQARTKELFLQTITALSEAVDAKDRYTSGHSKRVAKYSKMIAIRMGKSKEEQEEIYRAGLLHDVGKIRIPAEIINKPGKLTDEEYNLIKIHPITGYNILRGIGDNSYIATASKYHHERYDGRGYPNGLAGENIPQIARILGVADSYDAMASNRSYRDALPQEIVRSEIEKGKGTQFDPEVANIMLEIIDEDKDYELRETQSNKKRVLTVDDDVINHKLIARIMRDEPMYEIESANSGEEALKMLGEKEYDLVLVDKQMPGMDGLETIARIKENHKMPIVLMTSEKNIDAAEGFASYGCDDYITKPFLPLLLKEVIHNMTERTYISDVNL